MYTHSTDLYVPQVETLFEFQVKILLAVRVKAKQMLNKKRASLLRYFFVVREKASQIYYVNFIEQKKIIRANMRLSACILCVYMCAHHPLKFVFIDRKLAYPIIFIGNLL